MRDTWILVADSGAAHIYSAQHRRSPLELVQSLQHEVARLHPRDPGIDAPDSVHDRFGPALHCVDAAGAVKSEERHRFAREINSLLTEAQRQKKFRDLVVMAAPAFLGVLRECYSKPLAQVITAEIPKDLVAQDTAAIRAHMP